MATRDALTFSPESASHLEPYLPRQTSSTSTSDLPYATLTFATSLDSHLALRPGVQTALSGPASKAMTHFLRSRHAAILIGVGTAETDNPSLNCRLEGVGGYGSEGLEGQPRPVVIDPSARWGVNEQTKILKLVAEGRGKAPLVITAVEPAREKAELLAKHGGKYITLSPSSTSTDSGRVKLDWLAILRALKADGLDSVMIEGGAGVINALLAEKRYQDALDAVIVTVAPVWLGEGGVNVSPPRREEGVEVARLEGVRWVPLGEDVVLCGRVRK